MCDYIVLYLFSNCLDSQNHILLTRRGSNERTRYASTSSMLLRRTGVNTDRSMLLRISVNTDMLVQCCCVVQGSRANEEKVSVCVLRESQVTPHMIN